MVNKGGLTSLHQTRRVASKVQRFFLFRWFSHVLFDFRTNLASHFAQSFLMNSHHYSSSNDQTNCLASFALNLEPFIKHGGSHG